MFLHDLESKWLPAIADLDARLRQNPPARIANIGCGAGWSSIGIAKAYPKVRVDGFDQDETTIKNAWANARQEKLTDRITFHRRDVADGILNGRYDLVVAFDCIHLMSRPVSVLATMLRLAGDNGIVIVMDEPNSDSLRRLALAATFREVESLAIAHDFYQLYRLHR
jgi:2-polyprenyl-3-methyl-5-hydroxy-6-metoxy-1,4-benzoquinol methylase